MSLTVYGVVQVVSDPDIWDRGTTKNVARFKVNSEDTKDKRYPIHSYTISIPYDPVKDKHFVDEIKPGRIAYISSGVLFNPVDENRPIYVKVWPNDFRILK